MARQHLAEGYAHQVAVLVDDGVELARVGDLRQRRLADDGGAGLARQSHGQMALAVGKPHRFAHPRMVAGPGRILHAEIERAVLKA